MSLLVHLTTPICLVADGKLHAAQSRVQPPVTAACGVQGSPLAFQVQGQPGTACTVAWPPYVRDAAEWGFVRCQVCMTRCPGRPVRPLFAGGSA